LSRGKTKEKKKERRGNQGQEERKKERKKERKEGKPEKKEGGTVRNNAMTQGLDSHELNPVLMVFFVRKQEMQETTKSANGV
jgi:hypothetical protein